MHRYQVDAVSKLIAGYNYNYAIKPEKLIYQPVSIATQKKATEAILSTLDISFLEIPDNLTALIPPTAYGYPKDRETFSGYTGGLFDPLGAAEASASYSLGFLLHPQRLTRLSMMETKEWGLATYLDKIINYIKNTDGNESYKMMLEKTVYILSLIHI